MFAALMMGVHSVTSDCMMAIISSGVALAVSMPSTSYRSLTAGSRSIAATLSCIFVTMSRGVLPGTSGLMSYGADRVDLYREAAFYVDGILRGTGLSKMQCGPQTGGGHMTAATLTTAMSAENRKAVI